MCAIDLRLEKHKNCMLPNWRHQIFYNSSKHVKIGKVATAITVYLRFALGERPRDVPLTTVGQQFAIGWRNARKVITGKLYDSEGKRVKNIFEKTRKAYPDDPIDWDEEVANASNITQEKVMYGLYHQDRDRFAHGRGFNKDQRLKPVSGILEQTLNFPSSSDESQIPKLRVVFNQSHSFENQVVSKVASKEAREAVYRQVGIVTASASSRTKESQVKPLTVDTPTSAAEQMELGSPMTKMRRVMMSQEATPGVSGEPSQTEQKGELINLTNSSDEEMVDNATRVHPVKVKTKELDDDDVFTGLTDHNKDEGDDDDVFPGPIELPDSDNSNFGDEEDHDLDQIKMQYINDQQQKNRNTGEVMLMQMKTEIEETKDTGDQGTHQISLETEESFTPLSSGDTEEKLTIPSGEDTEASMVEQSEEVQGKESDDLQQAEETEVVMIKVKALERPKAARQEVQLYQPPVQRQRGRSESLSADVPIKPMDKELSKLAVMSQCRNTNKDI